MEILLAKSRIWEILYKYKQPVFFNINKNEETERGREEERETETKKEKKNEKGKERDYLRTTNTFLLARKLFLYPHSFSRRLYKIFLLI